MKLYNHESKFNCEKRIICNNSIFYGNLFENFVDIIVSHGKKISFSNEFNKIYQRNI